MLSCKCSNLEEYKNAKTIDLMRLEWKYVKIKMHRQDKAGRQTCAFPSIKASKRNIWSQKRLIQPSVFHQILQVSRGACFDLRVSYWVPLRWNSNKSSSMTIYSAIQTESTNPCIISSPVQYIKYPTTSFDQIFYFGPLMFSL